MKKFCIIAIERNVIFQNDTSKYFFFYNHLGKCCYSLRYFFEKRGKIDTVDNMDEAQELLAKRQLNKKIRLVPYETVILYLAIEKLKYI